MTFRYYTDQLAKMEPAKRRQLQDCASARTERWIDVPSQCMEPASEPQAMAIAKSPAGAAKPSSSYRPPEAPAPSLTGGPGDLVKLILDNLGIRPIANCGCEAMRRRMNEWGYSGCWTHREEVADWFAAKAAEAGIAVNAGAIAKLFAAAVWRGMTGHGNIPERDQPAGKTL